MNVVSLGNQAAFSIDLLCPLYITYVHTYVAANCRHQTIRLDSISDERLNVETRKQEGNYLNDLRLLKILQ